MDGKNPYPYHRGNPTPLGLTYQQDLWNFALFSEDAEGVSLCLYTPSAAKPFLELPLHPKIHKTGQVWHVQLENLPPLFEWGYKIFRHTPPSPILVSDPYATDLNTSSTWSSHFYSSHKILGKWEKPTPFSWENDTPPLIPLQDLVIYEMHVRGFTKDHTSSVKAPPGTFDAMREKIPYLKELGINAVELLPIFEFNENENPLCNPKTEKQLYNFWGYSTVNFFTLMRRYCGSSNPKNEFKELVKELHKQKIEVILDVVYNHTAEGGKTGPTFSFRGIDPSTYYLLGPEGDFLNFSGCGNTFHCNHAVVIDLIISSLRYWVTEMHVDGFRFDLASILTRDSNGAPLADPPLIRVISQDPVLSNCKLIAEAWDAAGLYQVGHFPHYGRWAEWNGKYRDSVRKFIKGTPGQVRDFSQSLCGSEYLYGAFRTPSHSINFITAHDGFSLHDLVSYNTKHNTDNGEENRDGGNDNESWNCGVEGDTTNAKILALRQRQMRNFVTTLFVSLGTPMVVMGDEYGHTKRGNNNTWSHDNELNWFQWHLLEENKSFYAFFKNMILFRKLEPLFRRNSFLTSADVDWHGLAPFQPNWGDDNHFLAYTLKDSVTENHLYIAFNAQDTRPSVHLPDPPAHKKWYRVVDTAILAPHDFLEDPKKYPPIKMTYKMEAYSCFIAKAL